MLLTGSEFQGIVANYCWTLRNVPVVPIDFPVFVSRLPRKLLHSIHYQIKSIQCSDFSVCSYLLPSEDRENIMAGRLPFSRPSDVPPETEEFQILMDNKREFDSSDELYDRCRQRCQSWKRFGLVARISLEILLCLLLTVNLSNKGTSKFLPSTVQHDGDLLHETSFGVNNEYMSLDHKYDSKWADEESAYKALVRTNPGDTDTEAQWGAVAMYVPSQYMNLFCRLSITPTGSINFTV